MENLITLTTHSNIVMQKKQTFSNCLQVTDLIHVNDLCNVIYELYSNINMVFIM